jgi:hypothetical protein
LIVVSVGLCGFRRVRYWVSGVRCLSILYSGLFLFLGLKPVGFLEVSWIWRQGGFSVCGVRVLLVAGCVVMVLDCNSRRGCFLHRLPQVSLVAWAQSWFRCLGRTPARVLVALSSICHRFDRTGRVCSASLPGVCITPCFGVLMLSFPVRYGFLSAAISVPSALPPSHLL